MRIEIGDIGGALVDHGMRIGTRFLPRGTRLTGEEVRNSFRAPNLKAMIDAGYLKVWPAARAPGEATVAMEPFDGVVSLHTVYRGFGRYDVIRGQVLNTQPLDKEGAKALQASLAATEH